MVRYSLTPKPAARRPLASLLSMLLVTAYVQTAWAAPEYQTQAGFELTLPEDPNGYSYWSLATAFPGASTGFVDGYPLAGRILAAHGKTIFLQETFGRSDFASVATVASDMDPSFIRVSPSGTWVALGLGYMQPLYVFPAAILSVESPIDLATHPSVRRVVADYYDATWRDDRFLVVNGGWYTGSALSVLDVTDEGSMELTLLLTDIPGASAGVAFDQQGNLITGVGWGDARTGELRIFSSASIEEALMTMSPASYEEDGLLLAANVLSATSLHVDRNGNLFVGGGDVFGPTGEYGYAALLSAAVLERVLMGGAPLDPLSSDEFTRIQPDPCGNDSSVTILYSDATDMAVVSADLSSAPPNCAMTDWGSGTSVQQLFFPPGAPDDDNDGIPNGMDPDYAPREWIDRAYLSRFVNAFGASAGDANFVTAFDLDDDGEIGFADFELVREHWGAPRWR